MTTLRVQSILFQNEPSAIRRSLGNLRRAAELVIAAGEFSSIEVAYGDCSPEPVFAGEAISGLNREYSSHLTIHYEHFGKNLGSARGHNTLLMKAASEFVLIMNPDVVVAPNALRELKRPFSSSHVGMVEARQLPIEHPKAYDPKTGETGWATTACAMIPRKVFETVGPFDHDTFFLYCDDVDFSWRVRMAGLKVIYQPSAAVFHDKRLSNNGRWMAGPAEQYYSAEAALMIAYKWSRGDVAEKLLKKFGGSGIDYLQKAAASFRARRDNGTLPRQIDPGHLIGEFNGDMYTNHRFAI